MVCETIFLSDKEIAFELRMSRSWVRKQRWLRRCGEDHVFTVDPILIGNTPRYRRDEVEAWINGLAEQTEQDVLSKWSEVSSDDIEAGT